MLTEHFGRCVVLALLLTGCLLYHVEWLSPGLGIVVDCSRSVGYYAMEMIDRASEK